MARLDPERLYVDQGLVTNGREMVHYKGPLACLHPDCVGTEHQHTHKFILRYFVGILGTHNSLNSNNMLKRPRDVIIAKKV